MNKPAIVGGFVQYSIPHIWNSASHSGHAKFNFTSSNVHLNSIEIVTLIEYQLRIASGRLSIVLVVNDVSQFVACGFVECEDADKPISGDVVHAFSLVVVS